MHHLNHVHRRGAVYVWRRRMPARQDKKREFVQVSLRTRDFSTAKSLASLLNYNFYDFIMRVQTQVITRAEAQQFLTEVRSKELERIESERYAEPYATTSDEWQNRYLNERARPVALRKFAMMGPVAKLFQEDIAELLRNGVDQSGIIRIKRHIEILANSCRDEFARETLELAKTRLRPTDRVLETGAMQRLFAYRMDPTFDTPRKYPPPQYSAASPHTLIFQFTFLGDSTGVQLGRSAFPGSSSAFVPVSGTTRSFSRIPDAAVAPTVCTLSP